MALSMYRSARYSSTSPSIKSLPSCIDPEEAWDVHCVANFVRIRKVDQEPALEVPHRTRSTRLDLTALRTGSNVEVEAG